MKTKIAVVVGPTASGKTSLSVELAKQLNGEVISCDSMQIYKKMNIGTAKPTLDEMQGIPHHLINFVEPADEFSCADYRDIATSKITEIVSKGKLPIFCGGTGLYVDHVLNNTSFSEAGRDLEYRKQLEGEINDFGVDFVFEKLKRIDPNSAEIIHPNNIKRVIRALEIYHVTGKTKTEWDRESQAVESPYDARVIFLDYKDREKLYERIDKRVDIMVENGLLQEVKELISEYEHLSSTALQAIGYKEIIEHLENRCSFEESIENIKKNSRNYAKRQLTWFRKKYRNNVLYVDEHDNFDEIVNIAKNIISD